MCVAVIGGMDRLGTHYRAEAQRMGIELRLFNRAEKGMAERLGEADAVVLFTGKVSHRARREVMDVARRRNIPVHMLHSCGVCTLRDCFSCLMTK